MLSKIIIHLKNIIFFKAVVYSLSILALSLLFPIFIAEVKKSDIQRVHAANFLKNEALKLEFINNFDKKITDKTQELYNIASPQLDHSCLDRTNFIKKIDELGKKYNLFQPIQTKLSQGFHHNNDAADNRTYNAIKYYTVDIHFTAKDFPQLLAILADLENVMPIGSAVLSTKIQVLDMLTPNVITKLNKITPPDNLDTKLVILLRTVPYEQ